MWRICIDSVHQLDGVIDRDFNSVWVIDYTKLLSTKPICTRQYLNENSNSIFKMFGSMEFCSKFISIGYCVFVVVKFSDVYAQKDYCSINNKCCPENTTHISCTNNGVAIYLHIFWRLNIAYFIYIIIGCNTDLGIR